MSLATHNPTPADITAMIDSLCVGSKPQRDYALAKAAVEMARQSQEEAVQAIAIQPPSEEWLMTPTRTFEETQAHPYFVAVTQIVARFEVSRFENYHTETARNLVAWARSEYEKRAGDKFRLMSPVFDAYLKGTYMSNVHRESLLDLCMKLRPWKEN